MLIAVVAVVAAAGLIAPVLRVRGYAFALATIAADLLVHQAMRTGTWLPGTYLGLLDVPHLVVGPVRVTGTKDHLGVAVLLVAAAAIYEARVLRRGHRARELAAIGHDEALAAAEGIDAGAAKRRLLVIGAVFGALAGVLYASAYGVLQPNTFTLQDSFLLAVAVVIGGRRSILGAATGALVLELIAPALGPDLATYRAAVLGVLVVVVMRWSPEGLLGRSASPTLRAADRRPTDEGASARSPAPEVAVPAEDRRDGAALAVEHLDVHFGAVHALDVDRLDVAAGELVSLVGPNGAGKSTLLGAVAGQVPSEGIVRLGEHDVSRRSARRRARSGLVRSRQHLHLDPHATVLDHVLAGVDHAARSQTGAAPSEDRRRAAATAVAEAAGLDPSALLGELDAGAARLADLARVVAARPLVALLDEPAAGLDAEQRTEVLEVVGRLHRAGTTIVVVEHDLGFVRALDARVVALVDGRVVADGSAAEVFADPIVRTAYLGTVAV